MTDACASASLAPPLTLLGGLDGITGQLDGWNQKVRLEPGVVATPRSWLLRVGWKRHGLLDAHAIPAAAPP